MVNLKAVTQKAGPMAALVFAALLQLSEDGKKPIKIGIRQIARETGVSANTTQRAINALEHNDFINVDRGAWAGGTIAPNTITINNGPVNKTRAAAAS